MKTSLKGMLFIAAHEAVVLQPYLDSVGIWTIGVGITKAAHVGIDPETFRGRISLQQALEMFAKTLPKYERGVAKAFGDYPLKQHEWDAAVSFHYNTGAIGKASWVRAMKDGARKSEIRKLFMRWNKPHAIVERRQQECDLLLKGDYGNLDIPLFNTDGRGHIRWGSRQLVAAAGVEKALK